MLIGTAPEMCAVEKKGDFEMTKSTNTHHGNKIRCLNGFEIKEFTDWKSSRGHWQVTDKGKQYIIFKFKNDKGQFLIDCPGLKRKGLTQGRAIKMLLNIGVSMEELSQIGNFPNWWNELFVEQGGTP